MTDISDSIQENATAPKKMSVDGASAEQHPLKDQIEADQYLKAEQAASTARRGLSFSRFRHQGTV